ncbi:MAG: DUF1266 domain-containing protein [Clostridiales bacterium]|nr:DUF1266 domain-containing protein [Clostridiales bacterium]
MKSSDNGKLLLDQRGARPPRSLFRHRIRIFENALACNMNIYAKHLPASSFCDIYPIKFERGTYRKGISIRYKHDYVFGRLSIYEDEFPGFADAFMAIVQKEWPRLILGPQPDALKWILSVTALDNIYRERNPSTIHGGLKDEGLQDQQRMSFSKEWGAKTKSDVIRLLAGCMNGHEDAGWKYMVESSDNETDNLFKDTDPRCFQAHSLQLVLDLASSAYLADFLSYEESLNWCLLACQKLQKLCSSWDDYHVSYLTGYSRYVRQDPKSPSSDFARLIQVYDQLKEAEDSMWRIPWNTPLARFWDSKGLVAPARKPFNINTIFTDKNAIRSAKSLEHWIRGPLLELSSFIEEGGHHIEDVEILGYCTLVKVLKITDEWSEDEKKPLEQSRSLATKCITKMLAYFNIKLDLEAMIKEYDESEENLADLSAKSDKQENKN